ncbi:DUF397 domain-containing protein [Pseudonocardia sp. C8]|uniref:DUF397 domain-containing protein n=1 Tax=Saccharopolyspora cebuensis TaxID=418759 RepID=A0ABV4CN48_9PSEU|nr:DUF397 domain-containing protein [Pseudonocardia sp. C8]MBC3193998.1 DUF397 domain-containing protein [Pseudonocardia sp. C8]
MTSNNTSTTRRSSIVGAWFKSTFSNPDGNQCVEVFFGTDLVHIRDSKDRGAGPVLSVPAGHWARFLDEVAGRAPAGSNTVIQILINSDGGASLRAHGTPEQVLSYTPGEWSAFVAGVRIAEFDLPSGEALAA